MTYFIRAIRGAGAHAEWLPLVGPFKTAREAWRMRGIVERACKRHKLYAGCTFGVWQGKPGMRGRLRLSDVVDGEWCSQVIKESER